ncbi:MAG: hypothetical protein ACREJC_07930 [Tepidisphaeraceae bacterium]
MDVARPTRANFRATRAAWNEARGFLPAPVEPDSTLLEVPLPSAHVCSALKRTFEPGWYVGLCEQSAWHTYGRPAGGVLHLSGIDPAGKLLPFGATCWRCVARTMNEEGAGLPARLRLLTKPEAAHSVHAWEEHLDERITAAARVKESRRRRRKPDPSRWLREI